MKFYPAEAKPDQIKVALDDAMLLFEHNPKVVLSGCELPEGASREDVRAKLTSILNASMAEAELYISNEYQVAVFREVTPPPGWPEMVHLSIKRRDRSPIRDWRELQEVKNAILGPECEAVELYPAESRRVDSANQYHLWAFSNPSVAWPFGFTERFVVDSIEGTTAQQRPITPTP